MNTGRIRVENARSFLCEIWMGEINDASGQYSDTLRDLLAEIDLFWPVIRLSYEIVEAHAKQRGLDLQSLLERLQQELVRIEAADSSYKTIVEAPGSVLTEYRAIE